MFWSQWCPHKRGSTVLPHAGYSRDTNLGLVHSGSVMALSSLVTAKVSICTSQ